MEGIPSHEPGKFKIIVEHFLRYQTEIWLIFLRKSQRRETIQRIDLLQFLELVKLGLRIDLTEHSS